LRLALALGRISFSLGSSQLRGARGLHWYAKTAFKKVVIAGTCIKDRVIAKRLSEARVSG
tara:strand:+ start:430 stop:609 length:180 start_codon:yes stop_codon:yes gene_type:complete